MSIYVEIRIRAPMEDLWRLTQVPDLHARWDLRFTDIDYLPRPDEQAPRRFAYATRIGFGLAIRGGGETVGGRDEVEGGRTSALKFWSEDPKSLIREGAGYWRYIPTDDGIRFLTSYDYRVRFGALGRAFDALCFRPLMGWATAWSFDRLRLWAEKGVEPSASLERALLHALARAVVGFVWLYQGAIPKLIYRHADELAMLRRAGIPPGYEWDVLRLVGWTEVLFGLVFLVPVAAVWPFRLTIVLMILATLGVAFHSPDDLVAAFNPVSLNVLMIALSLVGVWSSRDLPTARRCLRVMPEKRP